jgi:RHS repeat-associated protein
MINNASRFEHGEMGGGKLYGEYDNAGVLIREYIWLNGEPLAQIDKNGGTETVTYLHTDHLATPRYGTNSAGSTVWTWDSGAFGKEAPTGIATVNLRFPGQVYDSESTLHYNWNRYYNPVIGRYVSSDPIGIDAGFGTYGYADQNPVLRIDSRGLVAGFEPGFPERLKPIVEKAVTRAKIALEACKNGKCYEGKYCFNDATLDRIIQNLDKAKYGYRREIKAPATEDFDEDFACGKASSSTAAEYIYFSRDGLLGLSTCCGLQETLAHEAQHFRNGSAEAVKDEYRSLQVESQCFDCDKARDVGTRTKKQKQ